MIIEEKNIARKFFIDTAVATFEGMKSDMFPSVDKFIEYVENGYDKSCRNDHEILSIYSGSFEKLIGMGIIHEYEEYVHIVLLSVDHLILMKHGVSLLGNIQAGLNNKSIVGMVTKAAPTEKLYRAAGAIDCDITLPEFDPDKHAILMLPAKN
jgi:hypothetical protein